MYPETRPRVERKSIPIFPSGKILWCLRIDTGRADGV